MSVKSTASNSVKYQSNYIASDQIVGIIEKKSQSLYQKWQSRWYVNII